jgi:hypothetical protein
MKKSGTEGVPLESFKRRCHWRLLFQSFFQITFSYTLMVEQNISKTEAPKMTAEKFWLIVGSVAAVAAVIVGIYGFYFAHHEASKAIEATVISRSQLLNPEVHKKPTELHLFYKKNAEIFDLGIPSDPRNATPEHNQLSRLISKNQSRLPSKARRK